MASTSTAVWARSSARSTSPWARRFSGQRVSGGQRMKAWLTAGLVAAVAVAPTAAVAQAPAPAPASAAPAVKVAFVDVQRVLARSAASVAAMEQLEREKATMQKEMEDRRQAVKKMREAIK